jgi:5'-3' exonuclease
VDPASIPDYLALVGDSADGFPGITGWGAKSAAAVLAHYRHLEDVPASSAAWKVKLRGADKLAANLAERREEALLYRTLATLVTDGPEVGVVDDWRWRGARGGFAGVAAALGADALHARLERLARARA